MEVLKAIKTRRSVRSFDDRPLPAEVIDAIEDAILHSPSGSNAQESHFVIIQDAAQIRRIKRFAQGLSGQPAAVLVLCSNQSEAFTRGGVDSVEVLRFVNLGIAASYILLTTQSLGVGNCPVRSFHREAIKKILELPCDVEPELLISLGYPDQPTRPKSSKPVREVISFDQYGKQRS